MANFLLKKVMVSCMCMLLMSVVACTKKEIFQDVPEMKKQLEVINSSLGVSPMKKMNVFVKAQTAYVLYDYQVEDRNLLLNKIFQLAATENYQVVGYTSNGRNQTYLLCNSNVPHMAMYVEELGLDIVSLAIDTDRTSSVFGKPPCS